MLGRSGRGGLHRTVVLRQLTRVVNFVGYALSGGAQDAEPKFGKMVLVYALDSMAYQQVQDNWVDPDLGANALEQPAKIVRGDAGSLATSGLAFSEYPNQRLSQLGITCRDPIRHRATIGCCQALRTQRLALPQSATDV